MNAIQTELVHGTGTETPKISDLTLELFQVHLAIPYGTPATPCSHVQLWIEVAEVQTSASQMRPTYTRAEKQFTLVRPYKVNSVDFKSGPYSGGTNILVHGEVCLLGVDT